MIKFVGLLLILLGLGLFGYVGLYLCFIGGIVQIIEAFKVADINAWDIAWGIVRILSTGLAGWLSAILPLSFGIGCLKS